MLGQTLLTEAKEVSCTTFDNYSLYPLYSLFISRELFFNFLISLIIGYVRLFGGAGVNNDRNGAFFSFFIFYLHFQAFSDPRLCWNFNRTSLNTEILLEDGGDGGKFI